MTHLRRDYWVFRIRQVALWFASLLVVLLMTGILGHGHLRATSFFDQADTTVWYCAGRAVDRHADPYLVEPLRSCEIAYRGTDSPIRTYPWVEPAPLPGYALAGFGMLSRLPFPLFRVLWFYLLIISVIISASLLAKFSRVPFLVALLCLAMADAYFNLLYGELPPLVIGALIASAAFGLAQRYTVAAIVASISMIEPHLGLPACLAMFLWWPKTRIPFVVIGSGLLALSVSTIGIAANIEYFHAVLPAQAASEIAAQDQYSLTRILYVLGVPDKTALSLGSFSYVAMVAFGVLIARRVATALESESLIILLPPAIALLGGPYVHDLQMAASIPAALIIATSLRAPWLLRSVVLIALVFPFHAWSLHDVGQVTLLQIGTLIAALVVVTQGQSVSMRRLVMCVGVVASLAIATGIERVPHHKIGPPTLIRPALTAANDLSSADWASFVERDSSYSTPDSHDIAEKVPIWLGLIGMACLSLVLARSSATNNRLLVPFRSHPIISPTQTAQTD